MSELHIYFKLSEANSFWIPRVQPEIESAILKSVAFLESKYNCQIENDYSFPKLNEAYEISGTALYKLKDLPNLLKAVGLHYKRFFWSFTCFILG